MSWLPSADPILGDRKSCDALDLIVVPRVRDLGDGFKVRRALPCDKRQMVGPIHLLRPDGTCSVSCPGMAWTCAPTPISDLLQLRLFDGRVMHRDSEGIALED